MTKTTQLELAVNQLTQDIMRNRMALAGASIGADDKRPRAWAEYGWPQQITGTMLYNMYRRGGVAWGAVDKITGKCWGTNPWVVQGSESNNADAVTRWEKQVKSALPRNVWKEWRAADVRRLAGRYSALLLSFNDSQGWDKPVDAKVKKLTAIKAVWQSAITPIEYVTEPTDERYGLPGFWQYQETNDAGQALRVVKIHPDRVFILGDYASDAIGFLEPAYNALVSLEKVEGGSGESFLKNAARQLNINYDKDINLQETAQAYGVSVSDLKVEFDKVARALNAGVDTLMMTQGANVTPLVTAVSDPAPTYGVNLQTVAAGVNIPVKILVGQQTGERASSEDQAYFNGRCQSRRVDLGDEIHTFIDRLSGYGVLPAMPEFVVMWDNLTDATPSAKLANAKTMGEIADMAFNTGQIVFTVDEIRAAAGLDPLPASKAALPEGDA